MPITSIDLPALDCPGAMLSRSQVATVLSQGLVGNKLDKALAALSQVARAHGISKLARDSGVTRKGLYKAFAPNGNPELATILKFMSALDLQIKIMPPANLQSCVPEETPTAETDDIISALHQAARSYGITRLARNAGISTSCLVDAFGRGKNPEFGTILNALSTMGLYFVVVPAGSIPDR